MAYILNNITIHRPKAMDVERGAQTVQLRTLNGKIHRDIFGSEKRQWILKYSNLLPADYTTIETQYNLYLANQETVPWEITEGNYPVSEVMVHVDLPKRGFRVLGTSYISDFELVLTEE